MTHQAYHRRHQRGFLLLVIIGMLSVMLVLCIGFLSYTRGEVTSVASLRNRTDCNNAIASALDYTLGRVVKDSFNSGVFDPTKPIGLVRDPKAPFYHDWYKPSANMASKSLGNGADEAQWYYFPADFLGDGFARVRVKVQVSDTNGCLNINDWMEDANPTECQIAHMLQDCCDDNYLERDRSKKLATYGKTAPFNGGSVLGPANYPNGVPPDMYNCDGGRFGDQGNHPGYNRFATLKRCPYHAYQRKPIRYVDAFRMGTRTTAMSAPAGFVGAWTTLNEPYFTDLGREGDAGTVTIDRLLNSSATQHWLNEDAFAGYYSYPQGRYAYYHTCWTDPDTGRSPVNVNSGVPPGIWWADRKVTDYENYSNLVHADRVMRGVFNVQALRRIVRIGKCFVPKGNASGAAKYEILASQLYESPLSGTEPAGVPLNTWTPDEIAFAKARVEEFRGRLAYQYQETLVRYFTAFYDQRDAWVAPGYTSKWHNYKDRYNAKLGVQNSGAGEVKFYCKDVTQNNLRFPFGLDEFREKVKQDLTAMTVTNLNPDYNKGGDPKPATDKADDGFVGVDEQEDFEIAPGKMDKRTADAVWDNIVPGSQTLFPGETDDETKYPLKHLYAMKLARDEQTEAQFNFPPREGPGTIPVGALTPKTKGFPKTITGELGRDIALDGEPGVGSKGKELGPWEARPEVPERQLIFGPDWFSTELTTTTPNYVVIICAQIVDTSTGFAEPNILFNRFMGYIVEVAPDVKNETGGGSSWITSGLAYYKEGQPRKRSTDRKFMDANLKDGSIAAPPLGRKDATNTLIPGTDTSAALEWFDYRGVQQGQEATKYDSPWQTQQRVVVRRCFDFNNNSN